MPASTRKNFLYFLISPQPLPCVREMTSPFDGISEGFFALSAISAPLSLPRSIRNEESTASMVTSRKQMAMGITFSPKDATKYPIIQERTANPREPVPLAIPKFMDFPRLK